MKKRDKKIREKKKRQENLRFEKKHRLDRVLSVLGLKQEFRFLPSLQRNKINQMTIPSSGISVDSAARDRPGMEELKKAIEERLDSASISTDEEQPIPFLEFFFFSMALWALFRQSLSGKHLHALEAAATKIDEILRERLFPDAFQLGRSIVALLLLYSHVDVGTFGCFLRFPLADLGSIESFLTLTYREARKEYVEIDGNRRPLFQCGIPSWQNGFYWVQTPGEVFGLEKGRKYPIFIQSHALHRLRERLSPTFTEGELHFGLGESLTDLHLVERQDNSYRIEFRLSGHRVGYPLARVVQERIVVTTFLFLTMDGTPEFKLLYEKLRLTRRDINFQELNRLETFLIPVVREDPKLAAVLRECGCGSLLDLAREIVVKGPMRNRAEELKRFLRISDADNQKQFRAMVSHCMTNA